MLAPDPEASRKLDELYARVPTIACQGKCQECCAYIAMSPTEAARMERASVFVAGDVQAPTDELGQVYIPYDPCPFLNPLGRCGVYNDRPMICRLWGVTERMPCPWGCKPERVLPDSEGMKLLAEAMRIGGVEQISGRAVERALEDPAAQQFFDLVMAAGQRGDRRRMRGGRRGRTAK